MLDALKVIIVYILICSISYIFLKNDYKNSKRSLNNSRVLPKLRMSSIILISCLFTFYNWFVTSVISHNLLGSDRVNYEAEFLGERSVGSPGLQLIFDIVKRLGGSIYSVIYITMFICIFITLIAYKKCKKSTPALILLFFVSEYVFFLFTALKQSYSTAFACLFFANFIDGDTKKSDYLCLFDMCLSILFHSSGMILIPLFLLKKMKTNKNKYFKILVLLLVIVTIFLPEIMVLVNNSLGSVMPILSSKIDKYFIAHNEIEDSQWIAVLKYIPFAYIPFWGLLNRKYYQKSHKNFDLLLISSITGGLIVIYSIYIYWFSRFRFTFILPVFYLYDLMGLYYNNKSNRLINNIIVYGGTIFVTMRNIFLIFIKYGAF